MSNDDARFEDIKARLDEIAEAVSAKDVDLDLALDLYEEAVKLGMSACDASELDIPEEISEESPGANLGEQPGENLDGRSEERADEDLDKSADDDPNESPNDSVYVTEQVQEEF